MPDQIEVWAHCPDCDANRRGTRRYGRRVAVDPEQTHSSAEMECPGCGVERRLSIGSPTLSGE